MILTLSIALVVIACALLIVVIMTLYALRMFFVLSRLYWMPFEYLVETSKCPLWIARLYLEIWEHDGLVEIRPTDACREALIAKFGYDTKEPSEMGLLEDKISMHFDCFTAHEYEYRLIYRRPKRNPAPQTDPELVGAPVPA